MAATSQFHLLQVARTELLTREAMLIEFDVPEQLASTFAYRPGQHVTLRLDLGGQEERRSYSICSVAGEPLAVVVKLVADGLVSSHLHRHLAVGDRLEVMAPTGQFVLDLQPHSARHHLFIAAGSGITPIIAMLRSVLEAEPQSAVTLLYGNRSSPSVIFRHQLADLKDRYMRRFNLLHVLSREPQQVPLFDGRIDDHKVRSMCAGLIDASTLAGAYLCGPHAMIEAARHALIEASMAGSLIKAELFSAGAAREHKSRPVVRDQHCQVTITQDGATRIFDMPASGVSVLDAALAQGFDLPYSCKSGVCSTCRAKCVQGAVEMDANFALEDYEVAQGFVLSCQSFPVTDSVRLDYDTTT